MDRNHLIIATAAALFAAFALGWLVGLVMARLGRGPAGTPDEITDLARGPSRSAAAHDALQAQAESRHADMASLEDALAEARLEIAELRAYIDRQADKADKG